MRNLCIGLGMLAALPAMGQLVNRPIVTHPGAGFGGADASQICAGGNIFGHGAQGSLSYRVADKITVPASDTGGWDVDEVCLYTYQTSATTVTITGATLHILEGGADPSLGTTVWGDDTTNVMTSVAFSNVYRVTTTLTDTARRLQLVKVAISPPLHLDAGKDYWLTFNFTGTGTSGPWHPPSSDPTLACLPGMAMQQLGVGAAWAAIANDNFVPFITPQCASSFIVKGKVVEACYADCEGDNDLDVFDFLCFQGEWANKTPYGDCEGDNDWDVFDFLCFQGAYSLGC